MTELNEEERRRRVDTGMYDAAFSGIIKVLEGLPNLLRVFREGLA